MGKKVRMADWNSNLYLKFKNERTQPAIDLVNRIQHENPRIIIDIGCGPGNSTIVLKQRFPQATILGVDNSPNMIDTARKDFPEMDFQLCDAGRDLDRLDQDFDIVFSNACIQWIPDHPTLLRKLIGRLRSGGVLAVQTPMNYQEPIHQIIGQVTTSPQWQEFFPHPRIFFNLTPSEYFDLLSEISAEFSIWETTYYHRLDSHQDIMAWYRSTGLKPYLDQLPAEMKSEFEAEILRDIEKYYLQQKNGKIIFRFPRFFFVSIK
jgi:trans-aconitate 2-methyltransferase